MTLLFFFPVILLITNQVAASMSKEKVSACLHIAEPRCYNTAALTSLFCLFRFASFYSIPIWWVYGSTYWCSYLFLFSYWGRSGELNTCACKNVTHLLQEPEEYNYYGSYLADPAVRKAIHVGNLTYNDGTAVEKHLLNDVMASVKPWIAVVMDNYKVGEWMTRLWCMCHMTQIFCWV